MAAYSLETVIAEKFQTMIDRAENNSRMKDFFDVYTIELPFVSYIKPQQLRGVAFEMNYFQALVCQFGKKHYLCAALFGALVLFIF